MITSGFLFNVTRVAQFKVFHVVLCCFFLILAYFLKCPVPRQENGCCYVIVRFICVLHFNVGILGHLEF